jgi:hypothetical protein
MAGSRGDSLCRPGRVWATEASLSGTGLSQKAADKSVRATRVFVVRIALLDNGGFRNSPLVRGTLVPVPT